MVWLISAFIMAGLYVGYRLINFILLGLIDQKVIPYFFWLKPSTPWGNVLLSLLFLIPIYLCITILVFVRLREQFIEGELPPVLHLLSPEEAGKGFLAALVPVVILALILFLSLVSVLLGRLRFSTWSVCAFIWWGLFATLLLPTPTKPEKKQVESPPEKEKELGKAERISAAELIEKIKKSRAYKGQICWRKSEERREDISEKTPSNFRESDFLLDILKIFGIERLYKHQAEFLSKVLEQRRSVILATSVGSGRSTACDLAALYQALVENSNVLYICPNKSIAQNRYQKLLSFLENSQWERSLKLSLFSSINQDFDIDQAKSEVLFITPEILHQRVLPYHAKWKNFLSSVGFVVFEDIQFYSGVYGSNCSYLFRRLNRVLKKYGANWLIVCTSVPLSNLQDFANQLTEKTFEQEDIITTDHRGMRKKEIIFWNPPLERKHDLLVSEKVSPELRRLNFYEETKTLLVESLTSKFKTLIYSKQVLVTARDVRETNEELKNKIERNAEQQFRYSLTPILQNFPGKVEGIKVKLKEIKQRISSVLEEKSDDMDALNELKEDLVDNHVLSEKDKIQSPLEELDRQLDASFKNILLLANNLEKMPIQENLKNIEKTLTQLQCFKESTEKLKGLLTGRSDLNETFRLISDLQNTVELEIKEVRSEVTKRKENYEAKLSVLDTPRWVTSSLFQIAQPDFDLSRVDCCIMSGYRGSLPGVWHDLRHLGGTSEDSLIIVVTPRIPLSQYYKNHPEENIDKYLEEQAVISRKNRFILQNQILCCLAEGKLDRDELEEIFPEVTSDILGELPDVKREDRIEARLVGGEIEEFSTTYYQYQEDSLPHSRISMYNVEKDPFKITYAPAEGVTRQIGTVDENRRFERTFPRAVLEIENQRYRVTRVDDEERCVFVTLEENPMVTSKLSKVAISLNSFEVIREMDKVSLGRLDSLIVEKIQKKAFSVVQIRENNYQIKRIDSKKKQVLVKLTLSTKESFVKVDVNKLLAVEINPNYPFKIGFDSVHVRENIIGHVSYNAVDIEGRELRDEMSYKDISGQSISEKRDFDTYALHITFPDKRITAETLHALVHLIKALLPLVFYIDQGEVEVIYSEHHPELGASSIFIYDNQPGGNGIAEYLNTHTEPLLINKLLQACYQVVVDCPCRNGCPACLHIFKCHQEKPNTGIDKKGVIELLGEILAKTDCKKVLQHRYDKITDENTPEAVKLRNKIFKILAYNLEMKWKHPVGLLVSTERVLQLEKEQGKKWLAGIWNKEHDMLIVREYPEDTMIDVIAHEYTHDWQMMEGHMNSRLWDPKIIRTDILRNFPRSDLIFAEGFAEWVAYKALDFFGLIYKMEPYGSESPLPLVYKAGFEVVKYIEGRRGADGLLEFIKSGEGYDFEELYQKSGVKDYVLAYLEREKKGTKK